MIVGAYWSMREESREQAAENLARFLASIAKQDEALAQWFAKGRSRASSRTQLDVSATSIATLLRSNRRDLDGRPIPDLGFRIGIWNGADISLSATLGAYNQYVKNAVVLTFGDRPVGYGAEAWKRLLASAVEAFDPDEAVVRDPHHDPESTTRSSDDGWLTYKRGGEIQEQSV